MTRATRIITLFATLAWLAAAQPCLAQDSGAQSPAAAEHAGQSSTHGAAAGGEEGSPLQWATDLALWTLVVFIVLLIVLRRWAWGPLSDALESRERSIQQSIQEAERANREAQELLGQYHHKLDSVQDEVRAILDEARRDGQHTSQQIIRDAQEESRAIRERARREIERARDQALRDIWQQAAQLATGAAGRIIGRELKPADHQQIIEEALADFSGRGPN